MEIVEFILEGNCTRVKVFGLIILIMWMLEVAAVCVDFWSGTNTAKALGQKLYSNGFRRSFAKLGDYWRVTIMFLFIDLIGLLFDWYTLPFATILVVVCVITIEGKSVIENARAKKSQAAKIPEAIRAIIQCSDVKSAEDLLKLIKEATEKEGKNETHP